MRGGYRIIDFKNTALTSGEQASIENLYQQVKNPYKKACIVSGLIVSDIEYPDFYAVFFPDSENYSAGVVISGKTLTIEVTPDDNVTVTVADQNRTAAVKTAKK